MEKACRLKFQMGSSGMLLSFISRNFSSTKEQIKWQGLLIYVHTQTFDYSAGRYNDLKSIELTNINQNDHPEYFYKGS